MKPFVLLLSLVTVPFASTMAYEEAFEPTSPGVIEVKELPAGRLLEASAEGSYFDRSNELFRPLFNYIQRNDIAMTTPVEARVDPGAMYFWVSEDQIEKAQVSSGSVRVIDVPKRTVVALGARGSYTERNYRKSKEKLLRWMEDNPQYELIGEPFAVYWNGPFMPWFMKRYEIQVEVRVVGNDAKERVEA